MAKTTEAIAGFYRTIPEGEQARQALYAAGFREEEVSFLTGPGKGVTLVKHEDDDVLLGIKATSDPKDALVVETSLGGEQRITIGSYEKTGRGGRGREIMKRGTLVKVVPQTPPAPAPLEEGK